MKKLVLSLLVAGAVSIPASAMAIMPEVDYQACITLGPWHAVNVGTLFFSLLGDMPHVGCMFDVEWFGNGWLSTEILMDEVKTQGNLSCASGLLGAHSVLTLDGMWGPQLGFNKFQQMQPISFLILGEDGDAGQASGLIQFGPAVNGPGNPVPPSMTNPIIPTFVNGFEIGVTGAHACGL
jgi:hypothetical protein